MITRCDPVVIVFPGFGRTAANLSIFVGELDQRHYEAVAITLAPKWLPLIYMSKPHLRTVSGDIARKFSGRQIVLIAHSAGAASATYIAYQLRLKNIEIIGLIYADGVDSPNHLISRYLPTLGNMEIAAILAPPSPCNRNGMLATTLDSYPNIDRQVVQGAGHGDIEGAGQKTYRWLCKDRSTHAIAMYFRGAIIQTLEKMTGRKDHLS